MKLAGVNFKLNLLFLLVLFLFALSGLFIKALLTFTVVIGHELAHLVVAKQKGISAYEIELLPFGGVVKFNDLLQLNPEKEKVIAAAGPIFNFLVAAIILLLLRYRIISEDIALYLSNLNLTLGLFNLLPAFPLDGGRILRANLIEKYGLSLGHKKVIALSKFIAILMAMISVVGIYFGYGNITLLIIAFFIYFIAVRSRFTANYANLQSVLQKKEMISNEKVVRRKTLLAVKEAEIRDVLKMLAPNHFHTIYVVNSDLEKLGSITEDILIGAMLSEGINLKLEDLIKRD